MKIGVDFKKINIMKSYIIRIFGVFILLNLVPILWVNRVRFNIETFTTEYYKFLYSVFVVGLLALFFRNQTEGLAKKYAAAKSVEEFQKARLLIKEAIDRKNFLEIQRNWYVLRLNNEFVSSISDFELLNRYIESLNAYNQEERLSSEEFRLLTKGI